MEIRVSELVAMAEQEQPRISQLTLEQESVLVGDHTLLLIAVCVTNHWTVAQVLAHYVLSETQVIQALAQLDRLKLIELQPGNRVRLLINQDFSWIKGGPIERFFEAQVQSGFLDSKFNDPGAIRRFSSGMLSKHSTALMQRLIERLALEFRQLHHEDSGLALSERHGTSLVIAMRSWELEAFAKLRRQ